MKQNKTIASSASSPSSDLPETFPHGGGVEQAAQLWGCGIDDVLDLSTGLHPEGAPVWMGEWLKQHASLIAHYPDVHGEPARSALAAELAVPAENILITAGAQAVIEVIFQAMGWQSMAIRIPCYNEPIRCAQRAGCEVRAFEANQSIPAADIFWLTSPSNLFGDEFLTPSNRNVVLDESYMPFEQRRRLGLKENIIRIGSLTKSLCIPGLRLGYVIADRETIRQINRWLPPWPSSTLALHLLPQLIKEADQRDAQIIVARERLIQLLEQHDWQVKASKASFVLAQPKTHMPDFSQHRILVRQFPEWPQLAGWVRFGFPGNEADWQRLEDALTLQSEES